MRIGFVLQDPSRSSPTGLDSYTWSLWDALRTVGVEDEFVPVMLPGPIAVRAYLRVLWEQIYLPLWAHRQRIDLLHVPAGSAPIVRGRPCVLTLHDLGEEARPGYRTPFGPRLYFSRVVPWSARFASALVADSTATKEDAVARLGIPEGRITVVPLAPPSWCWKRSADAAEGVRRKYGLVSRYFLQVGAGAPRKNVRGALTGFARFVSRRPEQDVQFVVVGGRNIEEASVSPEVQRLAREGRVRFLGYVPREDLAALYTGTLAVVLPSFYEGFGLPLVEGFACGAPALASQVASLPEVGGDAALYIDPHDAESIAEAMERYATLPELRAEMARRAEARSLSFSWRRTAEQTLAVYRRVVAEARVKERATPSAPPIVSGKAAAPKVLFVRLDSLGDVVLTTPCFQAVKRRYPTAKVDVVVQPMTAPIVEADRHVDGVFTLAAPWHGRWRPGAVREVWQALRRLRRERYDYVITLRRDLDDALFARLCGGRRTLGFDARRTRLFLSERVAFQPDRHTAENHLRLMAVLGCESDGLRPSVACTSSDPETIDALLADAAQEPTILGVAPFGSSEAKAWGPAQTAALIDALAKAVRAPIVLLGASDDRRRADAVLARTAAPVFDLVGQTDLGALCDVLRRCRLLVCVDSGPMHLAAALGLPTVALFGEENPALWGPYGEAPHRVLRALDPHGRFSVHAVPVEMVVSSVVELLEPMTTFSEPRQPAEVAL